MEQEKNVLELCPKCKRQVFAPPCKCKLYFTQIEDWNAPEWVKIYADCVEDAAEKIAIMSDEDEHELLQGEEVEVKVNANGQIHTVRVWGEIAHEYHTKIIIPSMGVLCTDDGQVVNPDNTKD